MSQTEAEGLLPQIDRRIDALAAAEKQLKRPSTIAFAERRDLSAKAAKALAELRAHRAEAPESADAEAPEPLRAALEDADKVLHRIEAAQPAGLNRRNIPGGGKVPGQNRRGTGGMNRQTRPPDRVGE